MRDEQIVEEQRSNGDLMLWCWKEAYAEHAEQRINALVANVPLVENLCERILEGIERQPKNFCMQYWCGTPCCLSGKAAEIVLLLRPSLGEKYDAIRRTHQSAFSRLIGITALIRATGEYPPTRVSDSAAIKYLEGKTGLSFCPETQLPDTWDQWG